MGLLDQDQWTALGLLGNGVSNRNFSGGATAAMGYLDQAPDRLLKRQYVQAQMANLNSEVEARAAQIKKQQQVQEMLQRVLGGGGGQQAMPGQLGSGSFGAMQPPPGQPDIPAPRRAGIGGANLDDILALHAAGGPDLLNGYKLAREGFERKPGTFYEGVNGGREYVGDPTKGFDYKNGRVGVMPGYTDAQSAITMATEVPKAQAAAGQDLVKITGPDGADRYVTRAQAVQAAQPRPMGPPPMQQPPMQPQARPQPGMTGSFAGSPEQAQSGIAAIRDPQERANAQAAFEEQARRTPNFAQGGPFQASQSTAQATQAAADKEQAVQTVKDVAEQRKGIMNSGFVAPTNIAKYQQIGKLLADVDGGKYTPLGTEFASALNGFGIKIDKNLPNKQAAMSLANEAALQLRSPAGGAGMPGAMSDSDRNFLASMTPNISQSAEGRKMVIDSYVAVQQRNAQVADFARKYEKKYGKLDNGFFDQLSAWSTSNPLFKAQ